MGIVEVRIARDLGADEVRLHKILRLAAELHLCHDEAIVVAMKLIDLESMIATLDQVSVLIYHAALTELHQMVSFVHGDLLFKLIARHSPVTTLALDRQVSLIVAHTDAYRGTFSRYVSLLDMGRRKGGALIRIAFLHEKFPFYLQSTHHIVCFWYTDRLPLR